MKNLIGDGGAKSARRDAERAAQEARRVREEMAAKERLEKDKANRKLIRGMKGRFNPFEVLPGDKPTLGGDSNV